MKEHEDDVVFSVKESTETVDSTTSDEKVTVRGKIEGIFGERDEGEDMLVDVVGADVVVEDHGGTTRVDMSGKVGFNGLVEESSEREIGTSDQVMKDVGVVEEASDDVVESRVLTSEKVEVVVSEESVKRSVEVIQENVANTVASGSENEGQKSGNETLVADSKMDIEPLSEETEAGGGEIAVKNKEVTEPDLTKETVEQKTESVQEVANEDHVMDEKAEKEVEPLTATANHGSPEGHAVDVEEGLVGKDIADEDGVKSESSLTEVVNAGTGEENINVTTKNVEHEAGVDLTSKESLQPTIEVTTTDAQKSQTANLVGDSTVESLSAEPQLATGEIATKKEELEKGLTKETVEHPMESVKEVVDVDFVTNEKTEKDEVLDSTKIPESENKADEVVVEEGLAGKDGTQDTDHPISLSDTVNAGIGEGAVNENAEILEQKAEVDQMSIEESSQTTIEVKTDNVPKSGDSKMDDESRIRDPQIIEEDSKIMEPLTGSVQEAAYKDHVMAEKIGKEVLDSSKISEEVDVVVVEGGLEEKNEEKNEVQDGVSVEPNSVNAGTGEGDVHVNTESFDQKTEVDLTGKDESLHTTMEVLATEKSKTDVGAHNEPDEVAACSKVDEATIAEKEPNSNVQASTILVESQSQKVDDVTDSSKPSGDTSNFQEDQRFNSEAPNETALEVPTTGEINGPQKEDIEKVNHATTHMDYPEQHDVLPANSQFSYEEAHMERGDDAGMDIDEVLGWKDEIQEDEQNLETTNLSSMDADIIDDITENETSVSLHQSHYFHPPENEGEFSVSDLVWGKVRSHPWWPGQIFDPSDASEKAMKYHKKDCFLVAYFGDRSFAWNDSTVLKPFRAKFSQIEKHSTSESFNNAVHCALEEVSRRVELGLSCSCNSKNIYEKIEYQVVENAGIKQESSRRYGIDKSASVNSFEPDKLVDYVRLMAKFPYGESDKMELVMAKAQLSSYGRFKGYRQLSEFQLSGDLLEDEQVVKDDDENSSKKRKAVDSVADGSEKRASLNTETIQAAKPMFKVGDSIQRVASQLTGPPSMSKVESVDQVNSIQSPGHTQADMLSQLHLAAKDPMKAHTFSNTVIPFFYSHRAAVLNKSRQNSLTNDARKRKTSNENDPEEFEFDDVNDSYWTDRIIQNYPEEQLMQENQNGGGEEHQLVAYEQDKPVKPTRRSNKKRFFSSNHEIEAKEQSELIERRRLNLATEVLMKFTEGIYFPSEIHLNKMFRRFGPLMESETEVDRQSGRARVVFKKCSDAEVAHSSAGKFNIFGSINVNYELNYTPLISYKPLPLPLNQDPADAC